MTSISQQTQLPQASNTTSASTSTPSYSSAAKKAVSSPPIATGSSTQTPTVAVGGSAPVQAGNGKPSSISPVNGKPSISPAVPAVSGPAIAHSSSATNGGATDHSRKSSVTISANGPNTMNGGPVGGSKGNIQFGSITDSPAASHSTPQVVQPTGSAPISIPNPRVTDPSSSPTPIPVPSASGGRPPSGLGQGNNGLAFGSFGGDGDRHMRQASGNQAPLAPGNNLQGNHSRRDSSQSGQSDMNNQGGRGGFQGGRGRGNFNNNQYNQSMGFPPANNPQARGFQGQGRGGMPPAFQSQQRPVQPGFPNSPHLATRSPAMSHIQPNTPNMNQAMPMAQQQYNYSYPQHMGQQVQNPSSFTHNNVSRRQNGNHNRGNKKFNNWRRDEHTSSSGHQSRERSSESYVHTSASQEPMQSERVSNGRNDMRNFSQLADRQAAGPTMHPQHGNGPPPPNALGESGQYYDRDSQMSLPPLPSIPHNSLPSFPSLPSAHITPEAVRKMNLAPGNGDFENFLTAAQYGGYPQQPFPNQQMPIGGASVYYPQMQFMNGPPASPQPPYNQPQYIPGQYAPNNQGQPMSRNSSQMSEQRPASSMGQPQTPSMPPASTHTPQPKASTPATSSFSRPVRKSAAIVIKRPDGEAIDVQALKAPASPAPSNRARTPPVIASTPTPPPKPATPQHARTESVATKTSEQIRQEMVEKVKAAAEAEKVGAKTKEDEATKAADTKANEDAKAKEEADAKSAEESKAKEAADAEAAAAKAKEEEEAELERQIQEMEAAELEREKKEEEMLAKRKAEKAAADKANEEKRKIEAAENDRKLKEAEREMERLEDEREKKRAEAEAKAAAGDKKDVKEDSKDDEKAPDTPTTLADKLSNLNVSDSNASTPASDDTMGPPPKVNPKSKPAALNLTPLNTKTVDPPQPSAALKSLKSARFLSVLDPSIYPSSINSPNPALNQAVTAKGKSFKYDSAFLLQFQKVFTEKPSMEFESQIKALIGDGDAQSARSGSTRTPGGMGPRGSSARNNAPGAFAMGSFGAGNVKTLPPGTTSEMRFAMSSGIVPRPGAPNPMASFSRPGGAGFNGSNPMARSPSTSNLGPNSPRQQSNRGGRGSKRDGGSNYPNKQQEAQAAKTMPLTAGMDLKPIAVTASGWKPRSIGQNQSATGAAGPAPGASGAPGQMDPEMVQRKVKAALNKMTPEKFDKIADQILTIAAQSRNESDGRTLRQVIQLTFEKATDEAHWASMYAKFCKRMLETMSADIKDESILDKNNNVVSGGNLFRKYLLNRCQEEFERGWKMDLPDKPEGERGEEKTEEAAMLSDEYYIAAAAKRRGLGLVQFIGELYKLSMLTERIMHECVKKLVDYTGIPDEAEIESLTKLLKTIGLNLDSTERGKPMMDVYFTRIQGMIDTPDLPSRLRFMLMDIVDLRKKNWASKEANKGPKTLDEVRIEAENAAAQKAAENARGSQRGGGGGGRMQMGRGDSRNFSNQYGNQPPVDYQKNTVGMDDLRRLTNKNSQRASSQQMSFGPTSMFSSRSNSGRKMGPGGSLSRTGEDSGASSRTGTPPQQKESVTSSNAFGLLAALGSGDHDDKNPASPPSTSVSPALSKATPASAEKSDDKKED